MLIKKSQLCRLVPNRTSGGSGLSRSPIAESQKDLLVTYIELTTNQIYFYICISYYFVEYLCVVYYYASERSGMIWNIECRYYTVV